MSSDHAIFDRRRVRANRDRAAGADRSHAFLHDWAARALSARLGDVRRDFSRALVIGGHAAPSFDHGGKIDTLFTMDLSAATLPAGLAVQADEEALPFARESLDLIVSPLTLHTVNDLPGALLQLRQALKPDGLFLAAMLGGETLYELRNVMTEAELALRGGVSPRVAPFADKQQAGALLQRAGFALPVVDSDIVTVTYDNAFKLMRDLRLMGEGNAIAARDRRYAGRALFMEAARLYQEKFAGADGRIIASFEVIFLLGWSPHDSQQKPLKPGSASHRLGDVLGVSETGAGEKTGA